MGNTICIKQAITIKRLKHIKKIERNPNADYSSVADSELLVCHGEYSVSYFRSEIPQKKI